MLEGANSKSLSGERMSGEQDHLIHQSNKPETSGGGFVQERICVIANRTGIESGEVKACDLSKGRPPTEDEKIHESQKGTRAQASAEVAAAVEGRVEEGAEPTVSRPAEDSSGTQGAAAPEARYAGSSCVIGLRGDGSIRMYGGLGRAEDKLLVVDTDKEPQWLGRLARPEEDVD